MSLDLEAIKARAEAATSGPWEYQGIGEIVARGILLTTDLADDADAEFIAHARTDVPLLASEIERLRARLMKYEAD